ncbi:MAG: hypothetical protein ACO3AW_07380 [Chitinophagaceae bacterium]
MLHKIIISSLLIVFSIQSQSQIWLTGKVYDSTRMVTIPSVKVFTKKGAVTYTDSIGRYGMTVDKNDSIAFTFMGKSTIFFPVKEINYPAGFDISLQVTVQDKYKTLKEIVVIKKSYKQDSIENRERYRKVFEFERGGLQISETGTMGGTPGLDLTSLINSFRFKRNKSLRSLQNRLIEEEQRKFVDSRFTKQLVKQITGLTGTNLEKFMVAYRPPYELVAYAEEYQFYQYILDASRYFKSGIITKPTLK